MGWWSETVMGGDTPWDYHGMILEMCGVSPMDIHPAADEPNEDIKEALEARLNDILYKGKTLSSEYEDSANIWHQVLGVMLMRHGCKIPKKAKDTIIRAAKNDGWANEEQCRRDVMDSFIDTLNSYRNVPTAINGETLMEKFAQAAGKKKKPKA